MKSKVEARLDIEFEKMGVKPHVYHFTSDVLPFTAITIVDECEVPVGGSKEAWRRAIGIVFERGLISTNNDEFYDYDFKICSRQLFFELDSLSKELGFAQAEIQELESLPTKITNIILGEGK